MTGWQRLLTLLSAGPEAPAGRCRCGDITSSAGTPLDLLVGGLVVPRATIRHARGSCRPAAGPAPGRPERPLPDHAEFDAQVRKHLAAKQDRERQKTVEAHARTLEKPAERQKAERALDLQP